MSTTLVVDWGNYLAGEVLTQGLQLVENYFHTLTLGLGLS